MDQFLSVWPSTERSMCFFPCFSPKNPRSLPVMSGRGKKGMHRVLMLWATPAAFPLSAGGFWVGIWQWGLVRKARVLESEDINSQGFFQAPYSLEPANSSWHLASLSSSHYHHRAAEGCPKLKSDHLTPLQKPSQSSWNSLSSPMWPSKSLPDLTLAHIKTQVLYIPHSSAFLVIIFLQFLGNANFSLLCTSWYEMLPLTK